MPACKATDHELEEILAAACVIHSVPVAFDAKTADGRTAPFEGPEMPALRCAQERRSNLTGAD